jgi:hypothetical protein
VALVPIEEVTSSDEVDLAPWHGASSGLLDRDDLATVGELIGRGSIAAVLVYENEWVLGVADAWRRSGARMVADGGVPIGDLIAALDATGSD